MAPRLFAPDVSGPAEKVSTVSSQASLEEHIRHRYRQPKGIEQFGIEPIPEGKKTVGAFDIFNSPRPRA